LNVSYFCSCVKQDSPHFFYFRAMMVVINDGV
jgi:hypothetical protein